MEGLLRMEDGDQILPFAPGGRRNVDHGHSSRPFAALSRLLEGAGLDVPSWRSLADTPPVLEPESDPTEPKRGWRHVWPTLSDPARALVITTGPWASAALTALPTSRAIRIDPQPFPVCAGLCFPLPLSSRTCRCGRLLDMWPPSCSVFEGWGVLQRFSRGAAAGGHVGLDIGWTH